MHLSCFTLQEVFRVMPQNACAVEREHLHCPVSTGSELEQSLQFVFQRANQIYRKVIVVTVKNLQLSLWTLGTDIQPTPNQ